MYNETNFSNIIFYIKKYIIINFLNIIIILFKTIYFVNKTLNIMKYFIIDIFYLIFGLLIYTLNFYYFYLVLALYNF